MSRARFFVIAAALALFAHPSMALEAKFCLENCHGEESLQKSTPEGAVSLYVDAEEYENSVHGRENLGCADCHAVKDPSSHPAGDKFRATCGSCHGKEEAGYRATPHSREGGPSCAYCHTSHGVLPPMDQKSPLREEKAHLLCGNCHGGMFRSGGVGEALARWRLRGHGKGDLSEVYEEKMCLSCHAMHGEAGTGKKCPVCHSAKAESGEDFHLRTGEDSAFLTSALSAIYLVLLFAGGTGALYLAGRKILRKKKS